MDVSSINPGAEPAAYSKSQPHTVSADEAAQRRRLIQAAKSVNDSGILGRNQLVFLIDSQTHRPVIRVEDRETHEILVQIPPEYVLRLAEDLRIGSLETTPPEADT
ncbi:MAG: flagellar protein FlaG [Acidobacteriia bacterium]|nr:flagellar protein FlaG [Terriglobia bacterium]